jgi:glycosyltransferase involved in cell wall biosynthesis
MNILIISHYFPPLNSIASLRIFSWANTWKNDHNVTVLTSKKQIIPSTDIDKSMEGIELIEVDFPFNKKRAFNQRDRGASKSGWLISKLNDFRKKRGISRTSRMPDLRDLWIIPSIKAVKSRKFDVIISSSGPYASHIIARQLKSRENFWIADFRDLWVENHIYKGLFPFTLIESIIQKNIIGNADRITTVSNPLKERLEKKYECNKISVVENGFDLADYDNIKLPIQLKEKHPKKIIYTGTLYKDKQRPDPLLKAIQELKSENKFLYEQLQVEFYGSECETLVPLINELEIDDIVTIKGFIARDKILQIQVNADVLLFLEFEDNSYKGITTGKIFEYIMSRTPIWAIGESGSNEADELISTTNSGDILKKDIPAIKNAIHNLIINGSHNDKIDIAPIMKFERSELAKKMLSLIPNKSGC